MASGRLARRHGAGNVNVAFSSAVQVKKVARVTRTEQTYRFTTIGILENSRRAKPRHHFTEGWTTRLDWWLMLRLAHDTRKGRDKKKVCKDRREK